jgi:hypothetical protein
MKYKLSDHNYLDLLYSGSEAQVSFFNLSMQMKRSNDAPSTKPDKFTCHFDEITSLFQKAELILVHYQTVCFRCKYFLNSITLFMLLINRCDLGELTQKLT